jgi:cob(I)alamin adenosyltransferase
MIICYYGNGKGKTTAALGLALRASGYNKKILFAQFIKGSLQSGEDKALKKFKNITHKKFGLGFVGIKGDNRKLSEHRAAAQKGLKYIQKNGRKFDIIVLDEVFGAVKGRLIEESEIIDIIKNCSPKTHLIFTGSPKIQQILDYCDLMSEMKNIKHPYQKGQLAQKGIDF